ncbi:DoxX family protein [Echinicola vietnamensis]|uniref:Putative membrane protein n=1 Tax=Echinicola vietnamensis (strain DSM 17526 / LMG 23754 / KMM 6221) TaxID=926556 RepID=L0FX72_ECHVK|nr:hypothetical protein [Echinicola vietnamensis]AGA77361.1 putative membrane protein [Echinicola vietnamensis DSM 17526]
MLPLFVLLISFGMAAGVLRLLRKAIHWPLVGRIALSTMLVFTAMGHVMFTAGMAKMIPDFIPFKIAMVYFTGLVEIIAAVGIHLRPVRKITGLLLMIFFILMLPANIKAAVEQLNYKTGQFDGPGLNYLWFRIPFQILLIAWTYWWVLVNKKSSLQKTPTAKRDT